MSGIGLVAIDVKTYRKADGTVIIVPPEIEYTPKNDERLIEGIVNLDVSFHLGEAIRAKIELYPTLEVITDAIPEYKFIDSNGERTNIKFVEFENNTRWFPSDEVGQWVDMTCMTDTHRKYKRMFVPSPSVPESDSNPATNITGR